MNQRRVLTGPLARSFVSAASTWVQVLGDDLGLASEDRYRLELCVEEAVTNLVKYGGQSGEGTPVSLSADVDERSITLLLVDRTAPFDPLAFEPAPVPASVLDLQIGGRGIQLMREFSDDARYEYADGANRLALTFALAESIPPPARPPGLDEVGILQGVPDSVVDDALGALTILDVAGDLLLLQRGDVNDSVLLVLAGELRVHLDSPEGEEYLPAVEGECVGEMSVIDDLPVSAFVWATEGSRLLVVDAGTFLDRLLGIPRIARNLISAQAERTRRNDRIAIERMRQLMAAEQARREMEFARDIQASLLPAEPLFPGEARLDCVGRMRPARDVGGDFYDAFLVDERHLLFIVADVCGKGLPAALFMVRAIASLRAQPRQLNSSKEHVEGLMASLNEQLCTHNEARQFLTAFCGLFDLETLHLDYVNAGHNPPLVAGGGGAFDYLREPINPPIGMVPGLPFRSGEIQLTPGVRMVVYSDGVTEAENGSADMLGEDRLLDAVNERGGESSGDLVDRVFDEIEAFADGAPQSDDITVLAVGCPATSSAG